MKVKQWSEEASSKLNIQASGLITSWQINGEKKRKQCQALFSWAPKSLQTVAVTLKFKDAGSLEGKL